MEPRQPGAKMAVRWEREGSWGKETKFAQVLEKFGIGHRVVVVMGAELRSAESSQDSVRGT